MTSTLTLETVTEASHEYLTWLERFVAIYLFHFLVSPPA